MIPPARLLPRLFLVLAIALTIGCDRVTKHVATLALAGAEPRSYLADTVRIIYAENTGGFLSAGANLSPTVKTLFFTVATGLALVALALLAVRRTWNGLAALGLALFLAGGVSNWYDRIAHGHVVDFLNLGIGPVRTGIFNVADVAIMGGLVLFMLAELRGRTPA